MLRREPSSPLSSASPSPRLLPPQLILGSFRRSSPLSGDEREQRSPTSSTVALTLSEEDEESELTEDEYEEEDLRKQEEEEEIVPENNRVHSPIFAKKFVNHFLGISGMIETSRSKRVESYSMSPTASLSPPPPDEGTELRPIPQMLLSPEEPLVINNLKDQIDEHIPDYAKIEVEEHEAGGDDRNRERDVSNSKEEYPNEYVDNNGDAEDEPVDQLAALEDGIGVPGPQDLDTLPSLIGAGQVPDTQLIPSVELSNGKEEGSQADDEVDGELTSEVPLDNDYGKLLFEVL